MRCGNHSYKLLTSIIYCLFNLCYLIYTFVINHLVQKRRAVQWSLHSVSEDREADVDAAGSRERHHVQSKRRGGVSAEVYTEEDAASYVKKVFNSFTANNE